MCKQKIELGKKESSEMLLKDLFVDLRRKVNFWSTYTEQTPQARMGYIGQHLVSVVTGYKGGKSGARGYDLVLPNGEYGEIKTCTKIDQLGKCKECGNAVSSLEIACPSCNSDKIERKDDSKWLIDVRNEKEVLTINDPKYYYFVLFEFENINDSKSDILITIYRVNPKNPGFTLCMLDYWYTIKKRIPAHAPFNMWPHMLKFRLTKPEIIYKARITNDDKIITEIFNNNEPDVEILDFDEFSTSRNLDIETITNTFERLGIQKIVSANKKELIKYLKEQIAEKGISNDTLADTISYAMYLPRLKDFIAQIPSKYNSYFE